DDATTLIDDDNDAWINEDAKIIDVATTLQEMEESTKMQKSSMLQQHCKTTMTRESKMMIVSMQESIMKNGVNRFCILLDDDGWLL
nr:hypothetical protein [Tanacetum cinerariifolium]